MARLAKILRQLKAQRQVAQADVNRLDRAIEALTEGRRGPARPPVRKRRGLSAAARKKISTAQRARWSKIKARKKAAKTKTAE